MFTLPGQDTFITRAGPRWLALELALTAAIGSALCMAGSGSKDPLHGITLEMMVTDLVEALGFEQLGRQIDIRCFTINPSIRSSLKFLRRTPWARSKVENLYLHVCVRKGKITPR